MVVKLLNIVARWDPQYCQGTESSAAEFFKNADWICNRHFPPAAEYFGEAGATRL
jgi:hypothetical protein